MLVWDMARPYSTHELMAAVLPAQPAKVKPAQVLALGRDRSNGQVIALGQEATFLQGMTAGSCPCLCGQQ